MTDNLSPARHIIETTCAHATPRSHNPEVYVEGTWGRLKVDRFDGHVYGLYDAPECPNGERGYHDIVRVDVAEWKHTYPNEEFNGCDILDIGYWMADGTYEPPVLDWRYENNLIP